MLARQQHQHHSSTAAFSQVRSYPLHTTPLHPPPRLHWQSTSLNALRPSATSSSSPFYIAQPPPPPPSSTSSGFGLANLLNRSSLPVVASSSSTSHIISLPSLHAFTATRTTQALPASPQRLAIHTSDPVASTPSRFQPLDATSRRIAPAPTTEDDDNDNDDSESTGGTATSTTATTGSIRGGRWTADEHDRFLAGFRIHGHKWKRVQQVVRTRSVTQVRTHAQKYLLKVAKLQAEQANGSRSSSTSATPIRTTAAGDSSSSEDAEQSSSSSTAPSSPAGGNSSNKRSNKRTATTTATTADSKSPLRKKHKKATTRFYPSPQHVDVLDQEYIAAAATTLCFLMTQKIDSLFDGRVVVVQNPNPTNESESDALEPFDCYAATDAHHHFFTAPSAAASTTSSTNAIEAKKLYS